MDTNLNRPQTRNNEFKSLLTPNDDDMQKPSAACPRHISILCGLGKIHVANQLMSRYAPQIEEEQREHSQHKAHRPMRGQFGAAAKRIQSAKIIRL